MARSWSEMAPDLLANIFGRLSWHYLLSVIPCVCKPWQLASLNPLCYLSLDVRGFPTCTIDRLLEQILLPRSQGRLLHLSIQPLDISMPVVRNLSSMYLLARSAPLLQKLHIPNSYLDDEWSAYAAPLMPRIVNLNLNLCSNSLSYLAIEAFGKSCRHVVKLRRNRPWQHYFPSSDDEALAIAQYYPFLKHLELQNNPLSEQGLEAILLHCPLLESLDLAGCIHLANFDSRLISECRARIKDFREPEMYANDEPRHDEDYYDDIWPCKRYSMSWEVDERVSQSSFILEDVWTVSPCNGKRCRDLSEEGRHPTTLGMDAQCVKAMDLNLSSDTVSSDGCRNGREDKDALLNLTLSQYEK